jgi:hypothetical protein
VVVDRRVLIALTVAAIGFFCIDATNSPYQRPWKWGREDASDQARHEVADSLSETAAVRSSASVLPLLAERTKVYALDTEPNPSSAVVGVDFVIVTDQDVSWTTDQWKAFSNGMSLRLFVLTYDRQGVRVYTLLSAA